VGRLETIKISPTDVRFCRRGACTLLPEKRRGKKRIEGSRQNGNLGRTKVHFPPAEKKTPTKIMSTSLSLPGIQGILPDKVPPRKATGG